MNLATEFDRGNVLVAEMAPYQPATRSGDKWVLFKDAGVEVTIMKGQHDKIVVSVRKARLSEPV